MKERQRWQPEEDALLRAYVKQYGPKEWALVSQRMAQPINRDPKSCLERWKNYLRPGLKKGSLSPEEQSLVIELQAKYGNKWKKIAAELPGRTPKRLGKWWEVFREKQLKQQLTKHKPGSAAASQASTAASSSSTQPPEGSIPVAAGISSPERAAQGPYDHILETFAEKYVQPKLYGMMSEPDPLLSLGSAAATPSVLPPWMNPPSAASSTSSTTPSSSVSLSLSPSDPGYDPDPTRVQMGTLVQWCKEVEEGRQSWVQHKKEATWRLSRLEQQLESEKARKRREAMEEIEAKIRALREEEMAFMGRIESDYREQMSVLQREAESKEAKLVEAWCSKHVRLAKLVDQIGGHGHNNHACHGFTS
ncbi:protein rough sheath 2 homolog [Rosa rugosa]|uniref:protein rough sheath 2 homolog n=1 Tax=Rosa rugosa TaxID=74645 RepID=UPI002B40425D|nr:protein rough sheath 2 homolog [Rosa rugosa]